MVGTEYLGLKQNLPTQFEFVNFTWAFDGTDQGFTYKFYNNNDIWLSYIFKGTVRVDWAIEFRFFSDDLVFYRLVILNRQLTNMYLDFLYDTFSRQRHERVAHRVSRFRLVEPSDGNQDKAQTLIAKSVGFKKERTKSLILKF